MPADARPSLLQRYYPRLARHHYKVLLASLLLLVLGSGLAPASADPALFSALVLQNMLVGTLVVGGQRRRWLLGLSLLAAVVLEGSVLVLGWSAVRGLTGLVYSIFSLTTTVQVLRRLLTSRHVTPEVLAASMCGFVLLGMVGTFLFLGIDLWLPGSFRGISAGAASGAAQEFNYYSFTTLLTLGFGDVVPVGTVARKATVLLGLAGHFYDLFVVGVVVGKYVGGAMASPGRPEAADGSTSPPTGPA